MFISLVPANFVMRLSSVYVRSRAQTRDIAEDKDVGN
jgi:hypothetical protein